MKISKVVLTRLVLFALATLLMVLGIAMEGKAFPVALQMIAVASGEADQAADEAAQNALLEEQYAAAQALFDEREFEKAYEAFAALGRYSDSRARAADSKRKWNAEKYEEAKAFFDDGQYEQAKVLFEELENYKESSSYLYDCKMEILRANYDRADALFEAEEYEAAMTLFESLGSFHASPKRAQEAADMLKAQQQAQAERKSYETALALKEAGDYEGARDALIEAGDYEGATDQLYAVIRIMALQAVYERAEGHYADGDYESAYSLFVALEEFEGSAEKASLSKAAWQAAVYEQATAVENDDPARAFILFLSLNEYKDSAKLAAGLKENTTEQALYIAAGALAGQGDDELARIGFEAASPYQDSRQRAMKLSERIQLTQSFQRAMFLREIGEKEQANAIFEELGDFNNASKMISPVTTKFTTKQLRDDRTSDKSSVFTAPDGSKHRYRIYKGVHTWVEAQAFCEVLGGHLATLTTEEENTFVYQFMRESGYLTAYFGLSDEERVGDWIWVTGEPFEYSNWHRGQPSRSARERYGMYFYKHLDGTWNDSHFYETAKVDPGCSFICEWDEP